MAIKEQVEKVRESLKNFPNVKVVAAVKCIDIKQMKELAKAGIKEFGENRKEAFLEKYEAMKDYGICWHYFGIVKIPPKLNNQFIDQIDYLHSLDSIDLANAINKTRKKKEPLKCFVYVNIGSVANKAGLDETKVIPFIKSLSKYEKIEIVGLMTTGINSWDEEKIADYYDQMVDLQHEIQELHLPYAPCTELSMGRSYDYQIAVEHGSTLVRLGQVFTK